MISFSLSDRSQRARDHFHRMAAEHMRPLARAYDEREHDLPSEWVDWYWREGRFSQPGGEGASDGFVQICMQAEELCWGDAGLYLRTPFAGLGGSAVAAAGTNEQKKKFLAVFADPAADPAWGAMAITEAAAGSDSAAIQTTATLDGEHWVLNGTKIFCTGGDGAARSPRGFIVVWATVDKSAGRGGIKAFVVPAGTKGMSVTGLEKKLGIRASDTATISLENCRIPRENLLGSERVKRDDAGGAGDKGFKGAMATFDASRPIVAAMAVGVGRAALDFVLEELAKLGIASALRRAADGAHCGGARPGRDGGGAPGRAAPHLAGGGDDEPRKAQQPRGLDGEGQGGPRRHQDHPEGRGAARAGGLLHAHARREVDARRQDQRHLRGHPADQPADRRAASARLLLVDAALREPMPVPADLVAILVCPETKQPVALASPAQLAVLNERIRAGNAYNRGGARVERELGEALVRDDGRVAYPVDDGIPVMLVEESIAL